MRWLDAALWIAYAVFLAVALTVDRPDHLFTGGPLPRVKLALWLVYAAFLAYSVWCSTRESLLATILEMLRFHWGRQIGLDLYVGTGLALLVIYLHSGSALVALAWLLPVLLFVNLATLVWFLLHFDALAARLLG